MRLKALLAAALVSASSVCVAASAPAHATAGMSGWLMDGDGEETMGQSLLLLCDAEVNAYALSVTCSDSPD
jgi:hypothetical protein